MQTYPLHTSIETLLHCISSQYDTLAYFNPNHNTNYPHQPFESYLCFGSVTHGTIQANDIQKLQDIHSNDWLIHHLSYHFFHPNLKKSPLEFPDAFYFVPENIWRLHTETNIIEVIKGINPLALKNITPTTSFFDPVYANPLISKTDYIDAIQEIKNELHLGNVYEMNYCIPFLGNGKIDPIKKYMLLNSFTEAPFSCYIKYYEAHIISASPERFLKKIDNTIITQPIKGSSKRSSNPIQDEKNKQHLSLSEKERAENTMIVDLVRNDLSITAKAGSVTVSELFGLYTFKNIHQMISTVESELDEKQYSFIECLQQAYPMGSMTGAPKHNALKIINEKEICGRGPFSGSVIIKTPHGIDSNVLIRSIFYNNQTESVYFQAGSGITVYAQADEEYKECMLKAYTLLKTLETI
jgi:para-aminobenzoate synthetase component 1